MEQLADNNTICKVSWDERIELAQIALAAMDSEPVADVVAWSSPNEERKCDIRWRRHDVEPGPLYRHAQLAPVVPDAYVRDESGRMMLNGVCEPKIGFGTGWNACRATMLAATPQEVK
ncbi:hypothetical protein [Klebsiella pneumoniae]|uniref:hypothetical protein n=1 Tax=Klebsiella pneumoniae TaxID=573 RepID=UPI0022472055|nr:hypothetical protein [Klebsiella pneumoniae]MCW9243449.1 hypothetical protein [Klebsiella pneumoniae]HBS6078447.1 hypothetical protein [Klebsiella pneumoniae]